MKSHLASLPSRRHRLSLAAAVLALAAPAHAQWSSLPYDPSKPVTAEGFLLLHENPSGFHVFSAAARKWQLLAPPGSIVWGTGDWTVLIQDGPTFIGYSARRNAAATITPANPVLIRVDDDVALVVDAIAAPVAWAYSAVSNTWTSTPLGAVPLPVDVAVSRFVIAIQDGARYHGFAARTSSWGTLVVAVPGDDPKADGNTALVDLTDPFSGAGTPNLAAFSGVRGVWSVSPTYIVPKGVLLDHNVAYVRTQIPGSALNGCAYSAYTAKWVTSGVSHTVGGTLETISDNVVRLQDVDPTVRFEACGSLPQMWSLLPGGLVSLTHDEDYTIVDDPSSATIWAFSGICKNGWVPEGLPTGGGPVILGSPDHQGVVSELGVLHAFQPGRSLWVPPIFPTGAAFVTPEDALGDVRDPGTSFLACATRWTGWTPGPPVPPAPFTTVSGGAVVAHQQLAGVGAGDIYVFDERCDMWPTAPFNPGAVSALVAGRNLVISHFGLLPGPVNGYSVQRGDWTSPGAIPTPLLVPPVAEENVAWLVDGAGRLWGFGTPNDSHMYWQWPNGTEYHTSGGPPPPPLPPGFNVSFVANPGDLIFLYLGLGSRCPGIPIPGIGGLYCLDFSLPVFNLGFLGAVDPDCLIEIGLPLFNPLPPCIQLWVQPLIFDSGSLTLRWGHRCEPGWFY